MLLACQRLSHLFRHERTAAVMLFFFAGIAMILSNSGIAEPYHRFWLNAFYIPFNNEFFSLGSPLKIINDGLMTLFFLLVGLELKREIIHGQFSDIRHLALPLFAAIGGVAIPAIVFLMITWGTPALWRGWAIPTATDIAFALGVFSLLARRAIPSLKKCLVAIAIMDDILAILIIALFYSTGLNLSSGFGLVICLLILFTLNRLKISTLLPYLLIGVSVWWFVHAIGLHATLSGILLAFFIPCSTRSLSSDNDNTPLHRLERGLQPIVNLAVLPLFALANAGLSFEGLKLADMLTPLTFSVIMGLFLGKQIGVIFGSYFAVRMRFALLPVNVTWSQFYGMALLTGVGFTMSLFIGQLAFAHGDLQQSLRLGVIIGSLLSAIAGFLVLRRHLKLSSI